MQSFFDIENSFFAFLPVEEFNCETVRAVNQTELE
jgi:hypothetical protein